MKMGYEVILLTHFYFCLFLNNIQYDKGTFYAFFSVFPPFSFWFSPLNRQVKSKDNYKKEML